MGAYRGALKGLPLSLFFWAVLFAGLWGSGAFGQSVQQSGTITPNTAAIWNSTGVIKGGVTATDSPLTTFGVTRDAVDAFCVSSARSTAVGRNQLCFQASTTGPAKISLQNYGTAAAQNLQFVINGIPVTIPTGGDTFIFGVEPFVNGHVPCFVGTTGLVQDCGLSVSAGTITSGVWQGTSVALGFGGTGASSASGARTNLGLGTIATQNANSVTISGGNITGMPTPTTATDVAIKSYVDSTSTGLNILAPSALATAAVLPNTPTYANGASGVGATLTAGSNTTLTVDGTSAPLNTVVLVKNQASAFQNGIYTVTTAGSGAAAWVLTRATYFDQAAEMRAGSYTFVTAGATNIGAAYTLQTAVVTVGTDALTFVQFSSAATGTVSSVIIAAGTGISATGTCTITSTGTCTVANTGVTSVATDSTGITGGTITTTGTLGCSQATTLQAGCVKVDGSTITAASGVISASSSSIGLIPKTSTVTISNGGGATPGIISWTAHALTAGAPVFFCTTGSLPTGFTPCVPGNGAVSANTYKANPALYYVCSGATLLTDSFALSTTLANSSAGTCINTSSAGSGTHTAFANAMACAGCVGEAIWNVVEAASLTTIGSSGGPGVAWNSISLSAGIWQIGGNVACYGGGGSTAFTHMHASIVYGFTTISSAPYNGVTAAHVNSNSSNCWVSTYNPEQIFLTGTTTINGTVTADYSGGSGYVYGKVWARRIK